MITRITLRVYVDSEVCISSPCVGLDLSHLTEVKVLLLDILIG